MSDTTLFGRALSVTRNNRMMENNMGAALTALIRPQEALRIRPQCRDAENNLRVLQAQFERGR